MPLPYPSPLLKHYILNSARTTHVPVGEDQVQHLEFARECAGNFNTIYGNVLKRPETILC